MAPRRGADWPYSFERICAVLDLDANAVRDRLRLAPTLSLASVSREMQTATHERATVVSVASYTSVGSAHLEAMQVARSTLGVCSVRDDLRVAD